MKRLKQLLVESWSRNKIITILGVFGGICLSWLIVPVFVVEWISANGDDDEMFVADGHV